MAPLRRTLACLAAIAIAAGACAVPPPAPPSRVPPPAPAARPSGARGAPPDSRPRKTPPTPVPTTPPAAPRTPPAAPRTTPAAEPRGADAPAPPGTPPPAGDRRPVRRVGLLFPTQGPRREFGIAARRGAELCMEDPERRRPFLFEAVAREEGGDERPAAAVAGLADRERVVAVVGPLLSESAREALPAAERRSLPVISPTAAAAQLGSGSRVFFRTCMTMEAFTAALAARAAGRLGSPSFALLGPAEAYGRSLASAFGPALEAHGGRVVLSREHAPGLRDLVPWAASLAAELRGPETAGARAGWGVDGVFLAGSAQDAGLILPRLAHLGLDPRKILVVGTSALNTPNLPRLAGGYAEGALFGDGFFAGSEQPAARAFVRRFRERHGDDPGAAAAQGCAAVEVLAAALQGGAATPAETLAALVALPEVATVLGPLRVLPGGSTVRQPFFITVRGGSLAEDLPR